MTEQNRGERDPAENEEPIIRDKRRIDPETGKVREPNLDAEAAASDATADDAPADEEAAEDLDRETISDEDLASLLNEAMNASAASDLPEESAAAVEETEDARLARERLDDLRRVQAEYTNYRRRTEREKSELGDATAAEIVKQFLPVLDDLGRAETAGDLPEGSALQVIVAKFYATIEKLGVEAYGEKEEAFDPNIHEAIAQIPNPEVTEHTIADVVQLGYRIGEREIRPAKVAVFVPAE
ncbi:MAG: nucleotide exchange factor GrpE [Gulosibacter sp.]|uniref:nucleotide exchange factor GrpE n=1 Tax=Gulosibacter sp. TaxID=2817531 RepID=UPI003F934693